MGIIFLSDHAGLSGGGHRDGARTLVERGHPARSARRRGLGQGARCPTPLARLQFGKQAAVRGIMGTPAKLSMIPTLTLHSCS